MENVLLFFALKYKGSWNCIYEALKQKEPISQEQLLTIESKITNYFLTIISPNYPVCLKTVYKPPFVLFMFGDLTLLENVAQIVGVSGGKVNNRCGETMIWSLITELNLKNRIILTGDNLGVDQVVLQVALKIGGKIILVTKKPLQKFLVDHRALLAQLSKKCQFLIVSEIYEGGASNIRADKYYLRLLTGLLRVLVLVQISKQDFEYRMKDFIFENEKKLFVIPEPFGSCYDGSNVLIKNGAKIVTSLSDVANEF